LPQRFAAFVACERRHEATDQVERGQFQEKPSRLPGGVTLDPPARRIGRLPANAGATQRLRVGGGGMSYARQVDRPVGAQRVELLPGGLAALGERLDMSAWT